MSFTLGALRSLRHGNAPIKGAPQSWPHQAEQLKTGHRGYTCKLLGYCEVDEPKGFETVENAMEKIKFRREAMRKEGKKPKKVEIRINIHHIALVDVKTQTVLYEFPLHHVSYCADNKHDHRTLAFIAMDEEGYLCFAVDSKRKEAKEIALTIGQAFDLSYQHHIITEGAGGGANGDLKERVAQLEAKLAQAEEDKRRLQAEVDQLRRERELDESEPGDLRDTSGFDDVFSKLPVIQTRPATFTAIGGRRSSRDLAASLGFPVITGPPRQSRIAQLKHDEGIAPPTADLLGFQSLPTPLIGFHRGLSLSTRSLNMIDDEAES